MASSSRAKVRLVALLGRGLLQIPAGAGNVVLLVQPAQVVLRLAALAGVAGRRDRRLVLDLAETGADQRGGPFPPRQGLREFPQLGPSGILTARRRCKRNSSRRATGSLERRTSSSARAVRLARSSARAPVTRPAPRTPRRRSSPKTPLTSPGAR